MSTEARSWNHTQGRDPDASLTKPRYRPSEAASCVDAREPLPMVRFSSWSGSLGIDAMDTVLLISICYGSGMVRGGIERWSHRARQGSRKVVAAVLDQVSTLRYIPRAFLSSVLDNHIILRKKNAHLR